MHHPKAEKILFKNEPHTETGKLLRDIILGGQDGLVNVLGILLGVAIATNDLHIVLLAGLSATFAESISMAAVSYTSTKAAIQYYEKERQRELKEIAEVPEIERQEIRDIYSRKGFSGSDLELVVEKICSNREIWLDVMMEEELKLEKPEENPKKNALVVGVSAICGSVLPLLPFFVFPVKTAIVATIIFSAIILFIAGAVKAKYSVIGWKRSGIELAIIGIVSALAGFAIGIILGAP
ncbi:MAG: VIT1/CCC1 transporter family protein [Candidatus ainarchaeum sp.]|nr:VIT1/CCC1 transporter family protein [Candidatus ainarchaeum sp.]